jgi:hypothetical protein
VKVEISLERFRGFNVRGKLSVQCLSIPEILFQNEINLFVKPKGLDVNPSTPRPEGRGLPFDKLKALSLIEGLRVDPERRFFTLP